MKRNYANSPIISIRMVLNTTILYIALLNSYRICGSFAFPCSNMYSILVFHLWIKNICDESMSFFPCFSMTMCVFSTQFVFKFEAKKNGIRLQQIEWQIIDLTSEFSGRGGDRAKYKVGSSFIHADYNLTTNVKRCQHESKWIEHMIKIVKFLSTHTKKS